MTGGRSPGGWSGCGWAGWRLVPAASRGDGCCGEGAVFLADSDLALSGGSGALALPDVASRALRGSVVAASDEFFAEKENLINPAPPSFTPRTFGHKGQVYDGWETRRRRGASGAVPGDDSFDWAIVRLGAPAVVRAVVVDTAFFTGNYPAGCSVEGCRVSGYPPSYPSSLDDVPWVPLVARSPVKGDAQHVFEVSS